MRHRTSLCRASGDFPIAHINLLKLNGKVILLGTLRLRLVLSANVRREKTTKYCYSLSQSIATGFIDFPEAVYHYTRLMFPNTDRE